MDDDVVVLRLEGGKANAMTPDLLDTIERMIDGFERGPAAAAVLIGYERYFSGGLALPHIIDFDRVELRDFIELFSRTMTRVFGCEKPIVAAVNGHAIAGGCVLALMCDWRIAVDDPAVRIGLNETQLGIGMPAIVIESLRAAVPPASIAPIAIEGTLFAPRDALALGLVHELAAAGDLLVRATSKARTFAAQPAPAVAQVKHALRAPALETIARTAEHEVNRWLDTWFSHEAQARLRATVARLGGGAVDRAALPPPPTQQPPSNHSVTQPLPRLGAHSRRDPK